MTTETIEYRNPQGEKIPLRERINFRMVLFIGLIALLVGYPIYVLIDAQVSGGIHAAAGGYTEVDLKAMSTFQFDQANGTIDDVPQRWRALDGKKVIVHGEMWNAQGAGPTVDNFELVYSIAKCCFSGPPQIQHFVHSKAQQNARLGLYDGTVEVKGTLHVNVKKDKDAGRVASVYQLDVESVEPVR
jgi:hypothetical protein